MFQLIMTANLVVTVPLSPLLLSTPNPLQTLQPLIFPQYPAPEAKQTW